MTYYDQIAFAPFGRALGAALGPEYSVEWNPEVLRSGIGSEEEPLMSGAVTKGEHKKYFNLLIKTTGWTTTEVEVWAQRAAGVILREFARDTP